MFFRQISPHIFDSWLPSANGLLNSLLSIIDSCEINDIMRLRTSHFKIEISIIQSVLLSPERIVQYLQAASVMVLSNILISDSPVTTKRLFVGVIISIRWMTGNDCQWQKKGNSNQTQKTLDWEHLIFLYSTGTSQGWDSFLKSHYELQRTDHFLLRATKFQGDCGLDPVIIPHVCLEKQDKNGPEVFGFFC